MGREGLVASVGGVQLRVKEPDGVGPLLGVFRVSVPTGLVWCVVGPMPGGVATVE